MANVAECVGRFALEVLKRQSEQGSNSNTFSPGLSLELCLLIIYLGSSGKTAAIIEKALHLFHSPGAEASTDASLLGSHCDKPGGPHHQIKKLLSAINLHSNVLKSVIGLYVSKSYVLKKRFIHCVKELYSSEIESVDFLNSSEKVKEQINSWVESQTNGKIKNLLPAIDPSSVLVLVNAIIFKGFWKIQFNPRETYRTVFWTCKDQSIYVDMMTRTGSFNFATITNPSMKLLELSLDNELCLLTLVPTHNTSTDEIIKNLTYERLQEWLESMKSTVIKVHFPKCDFTVKYSLLSAMTALGLGDLLVPGKANLSGISDMPLSVSDMHFTGCFQASEDGLVGASASRAEIVHGSHSEFKINRAFIAMVSHISTGIILATMRICQPQ